MLYIPPSTPHPTADSPRKVTFSPIVDLSLVPAITDVENTAQYHWTKQIPTTFGSESGDDNPLAAQPETTPTGIKIHIPRPSPAKPANTLLSQTYNLPGLTPVGEVLLATPPASPPPQTLTPPPRPPSRPIIIFEPWFNKPASKLATKNRLSKADLAPDLPRASPDPVPDDAMDIDSSQNFALDDGANAENVDAADEIGPMLFSNEHNPAGTSFYDANEDRYAGLRNEEPFSFGEPINVDNGFSFGSDAMDVDEPEHNSAGVDDFLVSMDVPSTEPVQASPYRLCVPANQSVPPKPWTWTGRLTIRTKDAEEAETVCENATLTDATETPPNTPRIGSFVLSRKDLHFEKFYDTHDVLIFLPQCKLPHQFARLGADESGDAQFGILSEYMTRRELVALLPAIWDDEIIGYLLFSPPGAKSLLAHLGTPLDLSFTPASCLIVTLLFRLPPEKPYRRFPCLNLPALKTTRELDTEAKSPGTWRKSLHIEPAYHVALCILQLPPDFRQIVFDHPCAVWPTNSCSEDNSNSHIGAEDDRQILLSVLRKRTPRFGTVVPATDPTARVVFIHVSALKSIHNLPLLAQRRLDPKLIFCLYGMDPTIFRSRWGVCQIYPIGGVVTFTPEALNGDAWGVLRTIRKIHAHPAWECFLVPETIGMVLRLNEVRDQNDNAAEPQSAVLALDLIFDAILAGKVALMHPPPAPSSVVPDPTRDPALAAWVKTHCLLRPLTKPALLAHCTEAFAAVYDTYNPSQWATMARNGILKDMRQMQVQPVVVDAYRRFVVLDVVADGCRHSGGDGIEWNSVQEFQFHDDFLKSDEEDQRF
ncbi:hypothetical protein C8R43DRAFT_1143814 [Mycena crocata]|nr:hypothetical protein C8R43DRAFT_1143814 [Mycena crocata]